MKVFTTLAIFWSLAVSASPQIVIESGTHEPVVQLAMRKPIIGLASAGSTFKEDDGSARVDTVGSASLVRIKKTGRLAVLTAAHVVGGSSPWVELSGKKIPADVVWIDNDLDIAVLDIGKRANEAALEFGDDELKIAPKFMKGIDNESVPIVMIAYFHPGHALGFPLRPWVDAGVESAYTRSVVHVPVVSRTDDGNMIRVHTKITSGASGSAVLDLKEKTVEGLVVQSHYYFSETYLVSKAALIRHLRDFVSGRRGTTSATSWHMKHHLTYRQFADGTREANFITHPTSGVLGQPGAGVLGQPGAGVIGQPGAGVIGQPGNGVIGQPGGGASFQPWSQDPRAVFHFFDIEPGLVWKDQPVLGFDVKTKVADPEWPAEFSLLAEPEGARFLREHAAKFEVRPLATGVNLVDVLRRRIGHAGKLKPLFGPSAVVNLSEIWDPDRISVEILDKTVHVKVKVYTRMNRQTWKLEADTIDFTLGENGAPVGGDGAAAAGSGAAASGAGATTETRFLPVIETRGLKTGEIFYVDLRQFFFTDYSQLARPIEGWSTENAPFESSRFDFTNQIRTVGFSVRNANSGVEFTYGFGK